MAGSRRQYLGAGKPDIHMTGKLSSVTHASGVSNLDDRPKLNGAIIAAMSLVPFVCAEYIGKLTIART